MPANTSFPTTPLTALTRPYLPPATREALQDVAAEQVGAALEACFLALIMPWYASLTPAEVKDAAAAALLRFQPGAEWEDSLPTY